LDLGVEPPPTREKQAPITLIQQLREKGAGVKGGTAYGKSPITQENTL